MIDPSQVTDTTNYGGQNVVSTLNGEISLEEGRGRLVVREPSNDQILSVVDRDGLKVYDEDNAGKEIVRAGKFPEDNGYGFAVAEEGTSIEEAFT